MVSSTFASDEPKKNVLELIAKRCSAIWTDTGYAEYCFQDQMENMIIFEKKFGNYLRKYEDNMNGIEDDILAHIIIFCCNEYYDSDFDVFNYGMTNVCCEAHMQYNGIVIE